MQFELVATLAKLWVSFVVGHGQKDVTGEKYDENKSTIVTKQAVTSSNNVVQKSSIPEQQQQQQSDMSKDNKQESLVTISNQSPMEQLLQKESTMIHTKAAADRVKGSGDEQASGVKKTQGISSNIQTLSEHLKKVDEKADITALEENDAKKDHPKVRSPLCPLRLLYHLIN